MGLKFALQRGTVWSLALFIGLCFSVCTSVEVVQDRSLASASTAKQHHVSTNVSFLSPDKLKKRTYTHTDALFGVPFQKNRKISGSVYYMTPPKDEVIEAGCEESYPVTFSTEPENRNFPGLGNQVFLVDRGNCTFTQKVRIAQMNGAEAVLIANNECIQQDFTVLMEEFHLSEEKAKEVCCKFAKDKTECNRLNVESMLPFMASNGMQGSDLSITIPAFMITLTDSLLVKSFLCCSQESLNAEGIQFCNKLSDEGLHFYKDECNNAKTSKLVMADFMLDTPHPDNNVEYQLWMKSDAPPDFLESFEWFSQSITSDTTFTPNYIVINGASYNCVGEDSPCGNFCTRNGEYCAIPEKHDVLGIDVLEENVRQHCLWQLEEENFHTNGLPLWWLYQKRFREKKCEFQGSRFLECGQQITNSLPGLDQDAFKGCIDTKDEILKTMVKNQADMGIFTTAMIVNTRVIHFSLSSSLLAEVICAGFKEGTSPKVCECVSKVSNANDLALCKSCMETNDCDSVLSGSTTGSGKNQAGFSTGTVVFMLVTISSVFALLTFIYTRQQKRQMHDDVRNILAEYMPLEEVNGLSFSESHVNRIPTSGSDREDSNLI
mmetsp:Transcript_11701/g.15180  ORF Transcript_11701/g.15180 Transcript_11701/m.15180 type:complete len:605 (+) Transcript_11701:120-1934(+)